MSENAAYTPPEVWTWDAESGGQCGDSGDLRNASSRFVVEDTLKIQADVFGHHGRVVEGAIKVGDTVNAKVDAELRAKTVRNHSATHLMHKALREVLGDHVAQKGSQVTADRTRFDFAHNAPLTAEQIREVEEIVNAVAARDEALAERLMTEHVLVSRQRLQASLKQSASAPVAK